MCNSWPTVIHKWLFWPSTYFSAVPDMEASDWQWFLFLLILLFLCDNSRNSLYRWRIRNLPWYLAHCPLNDSHYCHLVRSSPTSDFIDFCDTFSHGGGAFESFNLDVHVYRRKWKCFLGYVPQTPNPISTSGLICGAGWAEDYTLLSRT